ncbi:MAG: hypothetical protein R3E42_07480 [Burkholderiaceae bacterium]
MACLLAYRWAGMSWADAFMHMCTTMGLGGFSSHDASIGHFDSHHVEGVATVFMALAGISFLRYFIMFRSRSIMPLVRDREIQTYVVVLLAAIGLIASLLAVHGVTDGFPEALRTSAFHVVAGDHDRLRFHRLHALAGVCARASDVSGCFVSCAGSTGGGIKMVRMVLLIKHERRELVRNHSSAGGEPGDAGWHGAAHVGHDRHLRIHADLRGHHHGSDHGVAVHRPGHRHRLSAVVATVNNIGPGLGDVGPASNFGVLEPFQIWVLSFAMLLGGWSCCRKLVLFTFRFWRK